MAKFADHLPLYRQAKIYRRHGCDLAEESLVRWVAKSAEWIEPVYERMSWELLQGDYLQADDGCAPARRWRSPERSEWVRNAGSPLGGVTSKRRSLSAIRA